MHFDSGPKPICSCTHEHLSHYAHKCVCASNLYRSFYRKSESLWLVWMHVPIWRLSRVTEHSMGALRSSQVCTFSVSPAEWQKGANSCCYAWTPWASAVGDSFFPVTSPHLTARLFLFLLPNLHLIEAIFFLPGSDEWFTLEHAQRHLK